MSKFAQERAKHQKQSEKGKHVSVESPSNSRIIIGNIVERNEGVRLAKTIVEETFDDSQGFPKPQRIDKKVGGHQVDRVSLSKKYLSLQVKLEPSVNKSIFAQLHSSGVDQAEASGSNVSRCESKMDFGLQSRIVENADAPSIHKENEEFLTKMGENEILQEQQRLLSTMDPSIVEFLKGKRKAKLPKVTENVALDVEMKSANQQSDVSTDLEVLQDGNSKNWLHFDVIEPAKLEWMRDLPKNLPDLKPGEQYEARFDWKGVLLPFKSKDGDGTATSSDLYLHGDDAHRPGYTLQELFRLARSTVVQQRISALRSVGGILSIYNQGYYDGIFELPISKVFFLLRYAFDDNTPAMLEESAKALSALFYNETDEVDKRVDTMRVTFKNVIVFLGVAGYDVRCLIRWARANP